MICERVAEGLNALRAPVDATVWGSAPWAVNVVDEDSGGTRHDVEVVVARDGEVPHPAVAAAWRAAGEDGDVPAVQRP